MRDPLARLPIRYKLTFGFVALCLLAYGIGAWLVSSAAQEALREQILARLRVEAELQATRLDGALGTALLRTRDFASDGLVRDLATRLVSPPAGQAPEQAEALTRHLAGNKLPLVPVFAALEVRDDDGLARVHVGRAVPRQAAIPAEGVGRFHPVEEPATVLVPVVAPLFDLERTRRVARLVAWVDVDRLTTEAWAAAGPPRGDRLRLADRSGGVLDLEPPDAGRERWRSRPAPAGAGAAPGRRLAHAWPLTAVGWNVSVDVDPTAELAPVSGLEARFLAVGAGVALLTAALLFFPLRFLVRPLARLRDAAVRIAAGDTSARVAVESEDEVGDLARAFNVMADAVRERTVRLEQAAGDLAARQAELVREHDRLETVVRSMQDALVFLDAEGRVALSNEAAGSVAGLLRAGAPRDLAVRCPLVFEAGALRDCVRCLARERAPRLACRIDLDGRILEVGASAIVSGATVLGRLLVARDVTEQVAVDERSAHQERLAVLGEVAAVVAHELNNPLSAIAMYAQMLEAELPADSPFREHAGVIRRNTEGCTKSIRGLLDWAWHAEPAVADVDLHEVIDEVALFLRPLLRRAGVTLVREAPLADPRVCADALQLRQVLVNLALNAVHSAGGHGGRVAFEAGAEAEGRRVWVDVVDDGPGVPAERRERIFEPFFTTKPAGRGTGLGLPIARRLVEAHGGALTLRESAPGRTVFRVELPRRALVGGRAGRALGAPR